MLHQLSFRAKLFVLGAVNLALISVLAFVSYRGVAELADGQTTQQATAVLLRAQMTADMMHDGTKGNVLMALNLGASKSVDASARDAVIAKFREDRKNLEDNVVVLNNAQIAAKTRKALSDAKPDLDRFMDSGARIVDQAFQNNAAAQIQLPPFMELFSALEKSLERLGDAIEDEIKETTTRGEEQARSVKRWVLSAALGGVLMLLLATALIVRSIMERTETAYTYLKRMTEGNLGEDVRMDADDEITKILLAATQLRRKLTDDLDESQRNAEEFKALVAQIQKSVVDVGQSITEIAATSKQQEASSVEAASTTTEVSATSKEISATSRELVKTMGELSSVAENSARLAGSGHSGLAHMEDTMKRVMEAAASINAKLAVLGEKAGNIGQVTTTIAKVADQTNLLSLNAAIEAEKAGEYGRGFAVVAGEIRRLADQTAVASYDIELMVKEIQSSVSASLMGMDKFSEEVRRGIQEVKQVGASLTEVIDQVQALSPRIEGVNEGMQTQAQGAEQITSALAQMSELAQQTVQTLRQSAQAIANVNRAMHDLGAGVVRRQAS